MKNANEEHDPQSPSKGKGCLKRLVIIAGIALLAFVLVLAALFGLLQTGPAKKRIQAELNKRLETVGDLSVEIGAVSGFLPGDIRIAKITVADAKGIFLTAEGLRVKTRLAPLIQRQIMLDLLAAERVELARLPDSPPKEPKEPFQPEKLVDTLLALPDVHVRQAQVERFELGEPIVGQAAAFKAELTGYTGAAGDPAGMAAHLQANGLGDTGTALDLDALLREEDRFLALTLGLKEQGGFVGKLLGLEEAPLTVDVDGEGPLGAWQAQVNASRGEQAVLNSDLVLALEETIGLEWSGEAAFPEDLAPEKTRSLVREPGGFQIALRFAPGERLDVDAFDVNTEALSTSARGYLMLDGSDSDFAIEAKAPELSVFDQLIGPTLGGSLAIDGAVTGPLERPNAQADIRAENLLVNDARIAAVQTSLRAEPTGPDGAAFQGVHATGEGRADGIQLPGEQKLPADAAEWSLDFTRSPDGAVELRAPLNAPALETAALVQVTLPATSADGQAGDIKADVEIADLSLYSGFLGQPLEGQVAVEAVYKTAPDAQGQSSGTVGEGVLQANASGLKGLPDPLGGLFGESMQLRVPLALSGEQVLRIREGVIDAGSLHAQADAAYNLETKEFEAAAKGAVAELAPLSETLNREMAGSAEFDLAASGNPDRFALKGAFGARQLRFAEASFGRLTAQADLQGLPTTPAGTVVLAAYEDADAPDDAADAARAEAAFDKGPELIEVSQFALTGPGIEAAGALEIQPEPLLIGGQVQVDADDLGELADYLGMELAGSLSVDAVFSREDGSQAATAEVAAEGLQTPQGEIQLLVLEADLKDAFGQPRGEARLEAEGLERGEMVFTSLAAELDGGAEAMSFNARAEGAAEHPFQLSAEGTAADLRTETRSIRLASLEGVYAERPVRLIEPLRVTLGPDVVRLSDAVLEAAGGRVALGGAMTDGQVDFAASIEALPLELLALAGLPPLNGALELKASLTGPADAPVLAVDSSVSELTPPGRWSEAVPPASIAIEARVADGQGRASLRAEGLADAPTTAQAQVPVQFSLQPFSFQMPPEGALGGSVDGAVDLGRISAYNLLANQQFDGLLTADLSLGGTISDPGLSGQARLTDGFYANASSGTELDEIAFNAEVSEDRIQIEDLTASDGQQSEISGKGFVDFAEGLDYSVEVAVSQARLVQRDDLSVRVSGDAAMTGTAEGAEIKANVTVNRGEYLVPDEFGPDVPTVEVVEVGRPGGPEEVVEVDAEPVEQQAQQAKEDAAADAGASAEADVSGEAAASGEEQAAAEESGYPIVLDADVAIPNAFYVRGRGLDSEWQGALDVTGPARQPVIVGNISVLRGTFDFLQNRFSLEGSRVSLDGAVPVDPVLDVRASTQRSGVSASLRAVGPISEPEILLESDPPMPDDEILAQLLFGRSINDITPLQAVRLAAALRALTAEGPLFKVTNSARGALNLDALDLQTAGVGGEMSIGVGKYVTEDVYVQAHKELEGAGAGASVEVQVDENITIEGEVDSEQRSGASINWRYDY